jgi:hypothetical protein
MSWLAAMGPGWTALYALGAIGSTTPETMKNLSIKEPRCAGTDHKFHPTICPQRQHCQRFRQIELDRQLELPEAVVVDIKKLNLPRVGKNECSYLVAMP